MLMVSVGQLAMEVEVELSKEEKQREALPAKTDEFIWVLDAAMVTC